jgi:hypothetical protein
MLIIFLIELKWKSIKYNGTRVHCSELNKKEIYNCISHFIIINNKLYIKIEKYIYIKSNKF